MQSFKASVLWILERDLIGEWFSGWVVDWMGELVDVRSDGWMV